MYKHDKTIKDHFCTVASFKSMNANGTLPACTYVNKAIGFFFRKDPLAIIY